MQHVIPYQGSKRRLAQAILSHVENQRFRRLYEPFAGSAAVTIAAAAEDRAESYVLADSCAPLVAVWNEVLENPGGLADRYEQVWAGQHERTDHYEYVRAHVNMQLAATHRSHSESGRNHQRRLVQEPHTAEFLYLLARCVKNAPRFNERGEFNQGADRRRFGVQPGRMRRQVHAVHELLVGRTTVLHADASVALADATPDDLVYLDPPWEGTSRGRDRRYAHGYTREALVAMLDDLTARGIPFLLSYDGRCGDRTYGEPLPPALAVRSEIAAGRSAQATLVGRSEQTVESLYISPLLA